MKHTPEQIQTTIENIRHDIIYFDYDDGETCEDSIDYEFGNLETRVCDLFVIKAALEAYAANQWQPIETAPKDGSLIYLFGKNVSGKTRRIQARYTQKHKEIAEDCDNTEWLDELADEYYYPEGWYEISWCNDDYHMYKVHDYNIQPTHWMPLPPSPSDKGAE